MLPEPVLDIAHPGLLFGNIDFLVHSHILQCNNIFQHCPGLFDPFELFRKFLFLFPVSYQFFPGSFHISPFKMLHCIVDQCPYFDDIILR